MLLIQKKFLKVVLKALAMAADGFKLRAMQNSGSGSGWDVVWFILYGLKGGALFIVIVLIGTLFELMLLPACAPACPAALLLPI